MDGCLLCGRGLHALCEECECCNPLSKREVARTGISGTPDSVGENEDIGEGGKRQRVGVPYKQPDEVRDPKSTGRKRAAILFPLDENEFCEWRGLANCGGGKLPIVGCYEGKQLHRHHGPSKDTLNNTPGNVHRICHDCHNIWHSQNDPIYDPENPGIHNPRAATHNELVYRISRKWYFTDEIREAQK